MADNLPKKNTLKIMIAMILVLVVLVLVIQLFWKQKTVTENEDGTISAGITGRIGVKLPQSEEA